MSGRRGRSRCGPCRADDDIDSKLRTFTAVVGADLIGGLFSGRTLKERMDEVEAELSRVKQRVGA